MFSDCVSAASYSFFSESESMRALGVNQNSEVMSGQTNEELKLLEKYQLYLL